MSDLVYKQSQDLLAKGLDAVAAGKLKEAKAYFKESARLFESADALTYWGWMEHHLGNTTRAIQLCQKAIDVDPEFGNPYNDIGSYLISLGQLDDAIPWLEKAVVAQRYEPRQYPHVNLGRIYLAKNMPLKAVKEFKKALGFVPQDKEVQKIIDNIQQTLN